MPKDKTGIHGYFEAREVRKTNEQEQLVTSKYYKCMFCAKELVYSSAGRLRQHLSGDMTLGAVSGGWGPCPRVPAGIADKYSKEIKDAVESKARLQTKTTMRVLNDERGLGSQHVVQPLHCRD